LQPPKKKRRHNCSCTDQAPTAEEKKEIDKLVASLFFGCNIPFAVIDSEHMKNLMKKLMPGYRLPCSKTLRTTLLDKLYDEQVSQKSILKINRLPCLSMDGIM
jgi:hypothetical protein